MTRVYRITRRIYARNPFDGEGSYRYGGRWSSIGMRLAYASEHQSLALLEYLVHIDLNDVPDDLVLAKADIPDNLKRRRLRLKDIPQDWDRYPAPKSLHAIGDRFCKENRTTILIVPSVLAPAEFNWLLNPQHPDFRSILIHPVKRFQYDRRLLQ